jgi:hypothetical protein
MVFLEKDRMMDNVQKHNICTDFTVMRHLLLMIIFSFLKGFGVKFVLFGKFKD